MSRLRYGPSNIISELVLVAVAIVFVFPLYVLFVISFKPLSEVSASPLSLPESLYVSNYVEAWSQASLGPAMFNSIVVTTLSILLIVIIGSLAAYLLSFRQQRLSYGLYLLFLSGITLPPLLALIPLYQLMRDLNLLGTYTSLIIFYAGHQLPVTIFLYAGFLRAMPRTYQEAALTDGATHFQAFTKVVFPLLRPVTGTVIIINGIFVWNDFLTPLLYVGGSAQRTLPVAIFSFVGEYATQWGLIFAGLVLGMLPILVGYFLLQKYIIKGFASGLKG